MTMKLGPLSLFSKTSSRRDFNLASWHSSHSLTWSWIVSLSLQPFGFPKPFALRNSIGFGAGLGQMLAFNIYRTNDGTQWSIALLWVSLEWHRQRPMWFRDIMRREWDRKIEHGRSSVAPETIVLNEHPTIQ